jgi:hypothetical protein
MLYRIPPAVPSERSWFSRAREWLVPEKRHAPPDLIARQQFMALHRRACEIDDVSSPYYAVPEFARPTRRWFSRAGSAVAALFVPRAALSPPPTPPTPRPQQRTWLSGTRWSL